MRHDFFIYSCLPNYASFKMDGVMYMKEPQSINVLELKRLLIDMKQHRPDICIRYRLIGQMWSQNFGHIVNISEKGVVLSDEPSKRLVSIPNLAHIMQFEIDKTFRSFEPYYHYDVIASDEWRQG